MNESRYEYISLLIQVIQTIVGLWGIIYLKKTWFFLVIIIVPFIVIFFAWRKYKELNKYVRFVEGLIDNKYHNFLLLPKLRMYLHKNKINNKVEIEDMKVTYIIYPSANTTTSREDELLGDGSVEYEIRIRNRNLPNTFYFIAGNDYSDEEPQIFYKIGNNGIRSRLEVKSERIAPYWRGRIKSGKIALDKTRLSQEHTISIYIEVRCNRLFEFKKLGRDTIICLPKLFSDDIDRIEYMIDVSKFNGTKFYCNAKRIYMNKEYRVDEINCEEGNGIFKTNIEPKEVKGESAYYFRIGLDEIDPEERE